MSNAGLERSLRAAGVVLERTQVGDRYVSQRMLETGANLGGEQSGHVIFGDYAGSGDGLFTAVEVLAAMARNGRAPLSKLAACMAKLPQTIVNVRVARKPELESLASVREALAAAGRSFETDGGGRVVLRYSGTEPLARVMVEAVTEERCREIAGAIADRVRAEIGA
jgi:phosphoglucosamine mutase